MGETDSVAVQKCLDRVHAGDGSARTELFNVAMTRLRLLSHKILADIPRVKRWEDTDDLLQNASVRLWKALDAHQPPTPMDFFRLAACLIRRELIDMSRSLFGPTGIGANHDSRMVRGGETDGGVPVIEYASAGDSSDPQKLMEWTEFHEYVEALPEEERILFDLIWYQGLTMAETSVLAEIPLRTLGRRWKAARVSLYKALIHEGGRE